MDEHAETGIPPPLHAVGCGRDNILSNDWPGKENKAKNQKNKEFAHKSFDFFQI
jgi:hypothetical protein